MATTLTAENATEALILEQNRLWASRDNSPTPATKAADGQVFRLAETCVLERGRGLLRQSLHIVLQARADICSQLSLTQGKFRGP